ncbi:hypothetical protein Mapa_009706 [Marchantia paleacea]|nr:hypothetical protein Mapa_009706 [Marchantia paleacea]
MVNSCELHIPVRVVRYFRQDNPPKKIYYYDGLYDVTKCYEETGSSGFKVWKFRLVKQAGQPEGSKGLMRGDEGEMDSEPISKLGDRGGEKCWLEWKVWTLLLS